jgi:hypothetical protein
MSNKPADNFFNIFLIVLLVPNLFKVEMRRQYAVPPEPALNVSFIWRSAGFRLILAWRFA